MDNTTWHDQRPSHKPIPHAVSVAQVHYDIAQQVYDDYVERCLNDPDNPLNWTEIDDLARRANEADRKLREAKYEALNPQECTCTPDLPDGRCFPLCDVCKADIDRRYGNDIPYAEGFTPDEDGDAREVRRNRLYADDSDDMAELNEWQLDGDA